MKAPWLLVAVLCLLWCTTASASYLDTFNSLLFATTTATQLEDEPEVVRTLLACRAPCFDLLDRQRHHVTLQRVEQVDLTIRYMIMGLALALCAATWQAVGATMQRNAARSKLAIREAYWAQRFQGVQDQAFLYAKKLAEPRSTTPAAQDLCSPKQHPQHQTVEPEVDTSAGHYAQAESVSTPPAPTSESSAPNVALLVAEAFPAKDTGTSNSDQLAYAHAQHGRHTTDAKGSPAKPTDDQSRASSVPRAMAPAMYPGQSPAGMPLGVGRGPAQNSSPAGRYSAAPLTGSMASPASGQQGLVGVAASPAQAGHSPSPAMASPPSGYSGARPMPGMAQRAGTAAPSAQWTPPMQSQQQHQALSCPPMPGAGIGSPYGAGGGAGPAPHSAGQLGAAGMPAQHRPGPGMPSPSMSPTPPGAGGWVTTSRGSGTPLPFGSAGPMPPQQQGFPSPVQLSPGGYPAGLYMPGSASTAQTAGSLTHVHSVQSTAGSCGGSVPPFSPMLESSTPRSAGSATSGGQGSSAGSRSPADRSRLAALTAQHNPLMRALDQVAASSAQKAEQARRATEEARRQQRMQTSSSPAAAAGCNIRQSHV